MYTKLRKQLSKEAMIVGTNSPASGSEEGKIAEEENSSKDGERSASKQLNGGGDLRTPTKEDEEREKSRKKKSPENTKIFIPVSVAKSREKINLKSKMQRKYNMALQHFYQAATNSSAEDDKNLKSRFKDLSGSDDDEEEELFSNEKSKVESYELMDLKKNKKDLNDNSYFFKKKLSVKRVKPVALCSLRGCGIFWVWCLLFFIGVFSMTYFLKIAIGKIQPIGNKDINEPPVVYERYHQNLTTTTQSTDKNITPQIKAKLQSCSRFTIKKVWHETFDKFQTESAIRLMDINKDGIDDVVTGFVTSLDSGESDLKKRRMTCDKNYHGKFPCFGGVYAVDGETGDRLWTHYSMHDIYAVNCNGDIDQDGIADCLAAGRGGAFEAISGRTGNLLWMFLDKNHRSEEMNLYTPQFINDVDNDGVLDILQTHGGDPFAEPNSEKRLSGKILFFSGKTGTVLKSIPLPDQAETYFSPVIYTSRNGTEMVVFGTGGETHAGSLFVIQLQKLYQGKISEAFKLSHGKKNSKGYMNPPVLVDINKDGVVDVISAGFSDVIQAFDGETLKQIWSYKIVGTETYSIPGVGYYNDDDTVDFMIRLNTGPGFPIYYDSKVLVLDGVTGRPITNPYKTSAPAHSSPLTVSMEGTGNDLFLFWSVDCMDHEHEGGWFEYVKGTNVHESSRADSCMARYNTKSFSKFYVTNQKMGFPGKQIYYSEDFKKLEHGPQLDPSKRHIGVPDHGGVQRIIQTGAIATSLSNKNEDELSNKFDVVFASYYITPPEVRSIRPEDKKCIEKYLEKTRKGEFENKVDIDDNKKSGIYDHGDAATNLCLKSRYNQTDNQESANEKNFNQGQLTLYRFQVMCECGQGNECARVLPKKEQGWSEYMGSLANGYFKERPERRFSGGQRKG